MRQTQKIALVELRLNNMIAEIESRSAIYEYPDVWAKGNAGETLNPSEAVIYATLIRDFNSLQYYAATNFWLLSGDEMDMTGLIANISGFLFENPGARREWEALRATFKRYREPHLSRAHSNRFEDEVRAQLAVLDEMHRSNK